MSILSGLGHAFKEAVGLAGDAAHGFGQMVSDAGNWFEGLFDGNPDAQAMPIAEIVKKIQSGYGSADLHEGAGIAQNQISGQTQISDGSHDLVTRLESAWSGQGADAARENIRPLALSADDASQTLQANAQHIQTQADTFDRIRNSVQPMPDKAPETSWTDNFVPWTTDAEQAVNQYNQQAQANQQLYDQYHQSSSTVAQGIKIDFGTLPDAQDAQVSTFQLDNSQQGTGGNTGAGQHSSPGGGPSRYQAPAGAANYSLPATAQPTSSVPKYSTPAYNDSTTTSGYTPPGGSGSGFQPGSFGPAGGGGYDPSGGMAAAGFGPMGAAGMGGAAAGAAGGGYGAGGGAGSAGSLQPGNRVGAGGSGGYGATPGAASAAGSAGAAGASGRPGMSGMGGGHGGGQGGEDEEHETKYLIDEDGDQLFGNDQKTAPPVIGL